MTQHSFTDVLTNIADVANDAKTKALIASRGQTTVNGSTIASGTITGNAIENGSITLDKLAGL